MTDTALQISQFSNSPQSLYGLVAVTVMVVFALILRCLPSQRHRPVIIG